MIKANYHAHTTWCRHSSMSVEDHIKIAINKGYVAIGISEHINLPNSKYNSWRLKDDEELLEYVKEVNVAKEKYKGQIQIYCGLESEVIFPNTFTTNLPWIKSKLNIAGIDFSLMSAHLFSDGSHCFKNFPRNRKILNNYLKNIEKCMASKLFLYMAHPNGFIRAAGKWDKDVTYLSTEIVKLAAKYDISLGINANGWVEDGSISYPNLKFFKITAKHNVKCIIEVDAHSPDKYNDFNIKRTLDLAKEAGVILLDKLIV